MRCSTQARWQSPARPLTLGSVIDDANFFGYTGFSAALPVGNQADLSFCEYLEVIIGISRDPTYGPVIVFGLGGTMVEVLRDVVFRALPVTAADAQEMVNGLRYRALLDGVRGAEAVDKPALCALCALLLAVSDIARAHPEIVEIDLNPVIAHRAGYTIADARVLLDIVWIGLLVARKTPRSVINKLNGEVVRTLKTPEVRERYRQLGAEEFYFKPAEFDAFLVTDTAAMGRIVKAAKIKLQ